MSDGPVGCRNWGPSTAYPASVNLAATFDTDIANRMGRALGSDCRARGVHILLGPGVNIHRSPLGGRNFEYLGEDPFLAGEIAAEYIKGLSDEGVLATVKHFVANNQERRRNTVSAEIDERTLREIYFPAFERAVRKGRVGVVMTAYNRLNGTYCSHNATLLKDVLRDDWGFEGFVLSDWGAVHDSLAAATSGCDLEMPSGKFLNRETLLPLIENGSVSVSEIDDKVRNILRTLIAAGFFDRPQLRDDIPLDDTESRAVALDIARRGTVLLKNKDNLLPINKEKIRTIALIGPNIHPAVTGGSGSSYVSPNRTVSLRDAFAEAAPDIQLNYHPGVQTDDPIAQTEAVRRIKATAQSADVAVIAVGFGQSSVSNSIGKAFESAWPPSWTINGFVETEGADRPFELLPEQLQTIKAAAAANPATVVVLNAGGAVDIAPFIDDVAALLWAGYPGQEGGRALVEILLGAFTPSGKLPFTVAKAYEDYPSAPYFHMETENSTPYAEGIFVGYRGFDYNSIEPMFPFGFGLSYTSFAYSDISLDTRENGTVMVAATITNTGEIAGRETVQVYIAPPSAEIPRAPNTLAGFSKVSLSPNESATISVPLSPRNFAYWDRINRNWAVDAGEYSIQVGASSRDIRLSAPILLKSRQIAPVDSSAL